MHSIPSAQGRKVAQRALREGPCVESGAKKAPSSKSFPEWGKEQKGQNGSSLLSLVGRERERDVEAEIHLKGSRKVETIVLRHCTNWISWRAFFVATGYAAPLINGRAWDSGENFFVLLLFISLSLSLSLSLDYDPKSCTHIRKKRSRSSSLSRHLPFSRTRSLWNWIFCFRAI